jgi:hypothetical protein
MSAVLLSSDENRLESEEGLYDLSRSTQSMRGQGSISDPARNDVKEQKHVLQDEEEVETGDKKTAQEDEEATFLFLVCSSRCSFLRKRKGNDPAGSVNCLFSVFGLESETDAGQMMYKWRGINCQVLTAKETRNGF